MHIHLIGIGGSGLSAIAQVLMQKGYEVSGSDRVETLATQNLRIHGARIFIGHHQDHLAGADVVLRSSAVNEENVEVQAARAAGIPVLKRSEYLGRMMEGQDCIAIAGTHGKTTTTAMTAWLLSYLHLDPSYIIGGTSFNLGGNAHAGKGNYFVIEADEYDYMFLGLKPAVCLLTNVEHDHPDCFPTYPDTLEAFRKFVGQILPSGSLIACGEDPGAREIMEFTRTTGVEVYSYGIGSRKFDFFADDLMDENRGGFSFKLFTQKSRQPITVKLQVPGVHNVRNALAVLALAEVLGLPLFEAAVALEEFTGTSRRFEVVGELDGVTVISDYAHHPAEIIATLSAARARYGHRRIWAIWQPHTYSRTKLLFEEFSKAFNEADIVLVTEVYAARETLPEDGFSVQGIPEMLPGKASYIAKLVDVRSRLKEQVVTGDVVIVLSAGDADQLGTWLINDLSEKIDAKPRGWSPIES